MNQGAIIGVSVAFLSGLCGCLGPRTGDEPGYSHRLWPEGREATLLEDNPRLAATVKGADGLGSERVPLHTAFLAGGRVDYWDFGEVDNSAAPVWLFHRWDRVDGGTGEPIGHLPLVDTAPGDDEYGPLRSVYLVFVTGRYQGEVIPSYAALEDAIELGLVHEPVATGDVVAWPMARTGAELELPGKSPGENTGQPQEVLYRGHRIPSFFLESFVPPLGELMLRFGNASAASGYALRRQNETVALDESSREADLNADGDEVDSNLILTSGPDDMGYSGLVSITDVTVPTDYVFGAVTDQAGLFVQADDGGSTATATVIEHSDSGAVYFRPVVP